MSDKFDFDWKIIGHQNIKNFLQTSIVNNSLAHAYLFYGPSKVGKTLTAKTLAKSMLCASYNELYNDQKKVLPCGQCEACLQFEKGIYADYYVIEREVNEKTGKKKSSISVTQIRELKEKISKRAFLNSYKIVIIPEADYLNAAASNSLLKTLEEPAPKTMIILITKSKESILQTIQSRSQHFKFLPITKNEIYKYLQEEGANRQDAIELASLSVGRPTLAMKLLADREKYTEFKEQGQWFANVFNKNTVEKFKFVEEFQKKYISQDETIQGLNTFVGIVRDLLLISSYNNSAVANTFLEKELIALIPKYPAPKLVEILKDIEKTKNYIKRNVNTRLALENLILSF